MRNLLSANFFRLRKSALFWGTLAVSFGVGLMLVLNRLGDRASYGVSISLDQILFGHAVTIGLLGSIFVSLFLGMEYSDGAIRNKVAAGHSRASIYLAGFLSMTACCLLFCLACLAAVLGLGLPLIGLPSVPLGKLLPLMAGSMVVALSFCSLFTLVAVNCSRKAVSVVVCMLGVIFMMSLTTYLSARLDQPEFRDTLPLVVNGQIVTGAEPNPLYLRGAVREVYQVLHDLLPYGQAMQYMTFSATHPERLPLYSLAVAVLSTGAGVLLFRRKDLK